MAFSKLLTSSSALGLGALLSLSGCVESAPIGEYTESSSSGGDSDSATDTDTEGGSDSDTTTDTEGGSDSDTTTDTDTGGSFCEASDPTVDGGFALTFGAWTGSEPDELAQPLHNVSFTESCTVASVNVDGDDLLTGLDCAAGSLELRVAAPRSGAPGWGVGEAVELSVTDEFTDQSVFTDVQRYVTMRRDGAPLIVAVDAFDNLYASLIAPIAVTYDGEACGGGFMVEAPGNLRFEAPGEGVTTIYSGHHGTLQLGGGEALDIDVARAHPGPCCHVGDSFHYVARAVVLP
ncbi:MAG: hypothetical protein KC486_25020 [Myxococcales bacterium]|nr:hypothetical protein [Myxococcales bacterium]